MLAVLVPFLKKFTPYIAMAVVVFMAGGLAGFYLEAGAVKSAKLALAVQQKNDAAAVAAANAIAVSDLAHADANANTAEAQLAVVSAQQGRQETSLTAQIASQAAQPGQDAPDAPVLAVTLNDIAGGNP